ncbi:MAG: hypothetical protein ACW99U_01020 [Candidatus Thorarchaeota archaeon]
MTHDSGNPERAPAGKERKSIENIETRTLGFKEDWAVIPYLVLVLLGFIVSIIDFVIVQMFVFQLA